MLASDCAIPQQPVDVDTTVDELARLVENFFDAEIDLSDYDLSIQNFILDSIMKMERARASLQILEDRGVI